MSITKRRFLKAGAIISIVLSVFSLISCVSLIPTASTLNENGLVKILTQEENIKLHEVSENDYYLEVDFGDNIMEITKSEIESLISPLKVALLIVGVVGSLLCAGEFVIAIVLLNKLKNIVGKGLIISLLVLSITTGNFITMAFMIVALCVKDKINKEVTLENINKIAEEYNEKNR